MVVVKPTHRADLGTDPSMGYVNQYFPTTRKVKVTWAITIHIIVLIFHT